MKSLPFNWATLSRYYSNQSLISSLGVFFVFSAAPIFQNAGGNGASSLEKTLTVGFYVVLMGSTAFILFGRALFEFACPPELKRFTDLDEYLIHLNQVYKSDADAIEQKVILYRNSDQINGPQPLMRYSLSLILILYFVSLLTAYPLGIAALIEYAHR
jgi:hypothetical protein